MSSSLGQPLDGAPFSSDLRFGPLQIEGHRDGAPALDGTARKAGPDGAAGRTPSPDAALRVLLVDDHEDMLSMMRMMMERRSYHVATALSGEQALQLAQGFEPHVVVSDIGMPGMDGYEMMLALRSMNALAPFKSIALSGYDAHDEEPRARAAGYDAQLTKPVNFDSLFQTIDAFAPQPD